MLWYKTTKEYFNLKEDLFILTNYTLLWGPAKLTKDSLVYEWNESERIEFQIYIFKVFCMPINHELWVCIGPFTIMHPCLIYFNPLTLQEGVCL